MGEPEIRSEGWWKPEQLTEAEMETCVKAQRIGFAGFETTDELLRIIMRLCAQWPTSGGREA